MLGVITAGKSPVLLGINIHRSSTGSRHPALPDMSRYTGQIIEYNLKSCRHCVLFDDNSRKWCA